MRKVTMKKFYEEIGDMDVILSVQGNYPYKTVFKTRNGKEVGVAVGKRHNEDEFFLYEHSVNVSTTVKL